MINTTVIYRIIPKACIFVYHYKGELKIRSRQGELFVSSLVFLLKQLARYYPPRPILITLITRLKLMIGVKLAVISDSPLSRDDIGCFRVFQRGVKRRAS